jgi:hypothetical protein
MKQRLSSLRSQLRQAQQLLPGLLEVCFAREPLLPGTLYTLRRRCGKPSCRCRRGQLHESTVLSYRGQGKPRNLVPAAEHLLAFRAMTDAYRTCRQARAQLVRWQRQVLDLVDALLAARVQLGEAEFQKRCAAYARPSRSSRS